MKVVDDPGHHRLNPCNVLGIFQFQADADLQKRRFAPAGIQVHQDLGQVEEDRLHRAGRLLRGRFVRAAEHGDQRLQQAGEIGRRRAADDEEQGQGDEQEKLLFATLFFR